VLGKVFHELIPFEVRKAVAAFYTNNEAAEILAQLAIDDPYAKVIDLAVGSGTLLVASHRRKRDLLLKSKGAFTLEDHKRFLEQDLTGIDIMPFAAHLAVVHLSLQALLSRHETERVRIAVWDSTKLKPGQVIPAISRELRVAYKRPTLDMFTEGPPPFDKAYVKRGALTLEGLGGEEIPLEQADVVIMNPPFTRQERIPDEYKNRLYSIFSDYEKYIDRRMGYYGYFVMLADRFTKTDGRIALVLPATILRLSSSLGLRKLILEKYHVEYIITTTQRAAFSEGAQFREILLIGRKLKDRPNGFLKSAIVTLKKLPQNIDQSRQFARQLEEILAKGIGQFEDEWLRIEIVSQKKLEENVSNIFPLLPGAKGLDIIWDELSIKDMLIPVKDYMQKESRMFEGLHLWKGDKYFDPQHTFVLRDESRALKKYDRWYAKDIGNRFLSAEDRITKTRIKIPLRSTIPGLRRLSGINKIDITDQLDFVVVSEFEYAKEFFREDAGDMIPKLEGRRKSAERKLCHIAIGRRFDLSAPGTQAVTYYSSRKMAPANMFLGIKDIPSDDAKILALWFNSTPNIIQLVRKRKETRGAFMQLNKYILLEFLVINPSILDENSQKVLLDIYEDIKDVEFPSILEQFRGRFSTRVKMDKAILKVLGYEENEIDKLIDEMYSVLVERIEELKELMAG